MMLRPCFRICILWVAILFLPACKSYFPVQGETSLIPVHNSGVADSAILAYYRPYQDSLNKIMKVPLAELAEDLTKKLPESTLGNLMVDILKIKTQEYIRDTVDVAVLNYGGIRAPSLTKGILSVEHAYLLMPFDNYLVAQILTGQQISDFCDSMALKKGWPVSGISFQIRQGKAINIRVNDAPVEPAKNYTVALNDYVANGGDGMTFLKSIPQRQTGILFRDAIVDYWKDQTRANRKITAVIENRITYAE